MFYVVVLESDTLMAVLVTMLFYAGRGNDVINGGYGNDKVYAGDGNDKLIYIFLENLGNTDYYDGGCGSDKLSLQFYWG